MLPEKRDCKLKCVCKVNYFFPLYLTHFSLQSHDDKAIAVVIPPYEYGVVCVDGVAYIRVNSETVRMTDAMRRNLAGKRILHRKDRSCNIAFLQEAISAERTVILHGYSSSNSGDVSDRTIEPFMFVNGHTRIVGYDLEKSRNSVFNISRIGSVEILDCRWKNRADHKVVKTDIFGIQPAGRYTVQSQYFKSSPDKKTRCRNQRNHRP